MSPLLETALDAPTEREAVKILLEGGYPRDLAEETAAIAYGSSQGDVIEIRDDDQVKP